MSLVKLVNFQPHQPLFYKMFTLSGLLQSAPYVLFASKFVSDELLQQFEALNYEKVKQFLVGTRGLPAAAALRGQLFESHTHRVLTNPGNRKKYYEV